MAIIFLNVFFPKRSIASIIWDFLCFFSPDLVMVLSFFRLLSWSRTGIVCCPKNYYSRFNFHLSFYLLRSIYGMFENFEAWSSSKIDENACYSCIILSVIEPTYTYWPSWLIGWKVLGWQEVLWVWDFMFPGEVYNVWERKGHRNGKRQWTFWESWPW